jgi:hypothetical protein
MNWRNLQLDGQLCDQDKVIVSIYDQMPVRYLGDDIDFAQYLTIDEQSRHIVAIFNQPGWMTDFIRFIDNLKDASSFYLGINRYLIIGNDTSIAFDNNLTNSECLIDFVIKHLQNFKISKQGFNENDNGRYFNFVQPLTWIYATNFSN